MDLGTDASLQLKDQHTGTIILCGGATCTVQLPTPASLVAGWWCRFVINDETAAVTIMGVTDTIKGHICTGSDNTNQQLQPTSPALSDVISFTTNVVFGDWVELVCDGTAYYISGRSRVTNAITLTSP
jgi:hypothetical protein